MLLGIVLSGFYAPSLLTKLNLGTIVWAFFATCIVASSNYVINELLDAPTDRSHPEKHRRPIPSGQVKVSWAYVEWLALGALGLWMAWELNVAFFLAATILWTMGLVYNVPPVRSKELPYLDVISESINNPLRLALGWFVVSESTVPPVSLLISYWMVGAFFMASKRFAEYRSINDPARAAAYRSSFRYYDDNRLLTSMFFYATSSALFLGVFIIRYHLELILSVPLIAGFFSAYMHVTFKQDSAAQKPERLYRETGLMIYLMVCVAAFTVLMFVHIPWLYDIFNVSPSELPPLWKL